MEIELANHCRDLDSRFYGLGTKSLRSLAFQFAQLNGLAHRFNENKKMAGKDWVYSFCKRQNLSLRAPEKCSLGRAMGFNRTQVERFFKNLKKIMTEKRIPPHRMFNMDESGLSTVPNKIPKVFAQKGKKLVGKVVSGERGQTITIVCCMSPTGIFVHPAMIFPRKRMKPELYYGAPHGTLPLISDSGYMNSEIFIDWLKHFQAFVKSCEDNPTLLILDNHISHRSLSAILYCREHHITLLSLPPHASHMMQPLDRSFFGPLKTAYSNEVDKWMTTNAGLTVNQTHVAQLFDAAYSKVATIPVAKNGFRKTGIFPYDDGIFSDEDFRPSEVTDKPLNVPNDEHNSDSDNEPLILIAEKLKKITDNQDYQEPSTSNIAIHKTPPSTPIKNDSSTKFISPSQIHPVPKAPIKNERRKRRSQKSEIMTSSPFKNALLDKEPSTSQAKACVKKKVLQVSKNINSNKKGKEKTKKNEVCCPSCSIAENGDDWILCSQCDLWWHEHCSSYDHEGIFICDFCAVQM